MERIDLKGKKITSIEVFEDRLEINFEEETPRYTNAIEGKPAIMWSESKMDAVICIYEEYAEDAAFPFQGNGGWYDNAILFESIDQYLEFIKS